MWKFAKRTLIVFGVAIALLILIATATTYFIIPMYLSSEEGKSLLEIKMAEALNGKVSIADTEMSWTGGLTIKDLKIDDAKKNDITFWMDANEVTLIPSYISLISDTITISSFVLPYIFTFRTTYRL